MNAQKEQQLRVIQQDLQSVVDRIKKHTPQTAELEAAARELQSFVHKMDPKKVTSEILNDIASKMQSVIDRLENTSFKDEAPGLMDELRKIKARIQALAATM